ncbi:MAG: macro domain-containing protein [Bacteroidota bacterium]|nr:RNase III inhibitor [Christiangramia sp.]MEE2772059.1 macro domain-containing protein [Bacteroidota bacterium]|tara:strand:+ start:255 stop:797 length:543 start_codon:yes stop_codon:yes gene_type:complete
MEIVLHSVKIETVQGDITRQPDLDVVVNAANAQLAPGGGVAGAIHQAAGRELYEACKILAPIKPGQAVITKAFQLPNQFVVHCLGPVYGKDSPEAELLASCYRNSVQLCEENGLKSIGFPAISTGIFSYPVREAVKVVFRSLAENLSETEKIKRIKFVLFSREDLEVYDREMTRYAEATK